MSLLPGIKLINVNDPRIDIKRERDFVCVRGGQIVNFQQFNQNGVADNNSAQIVCNPPGPGFIVDRYIKCLSTNVTMNFTASANTVSPEVGLLDSQGDAFRAFPLSTNMTTLNLYVNTQNTSLFLSNYLQAFLRYHNPSSTQYGIYSMTPAELDKTVNYADLFGYVQNPLAGYGDSVYGAVIHRGAFPYKSYSNPLGGTTAQVVADICEPLMIAPCTWGPITASGFVGIQNMNVSITWGNLARMWSHAPLSFENGSIANFNVVPTLGMISLEFCYITPKITMAIPASVSYPFYPINYTSQAVSGSIAPLQTATVVMNNVQFSQVPRAIMIFARKSLQVATFTDPDIFYPITNLNISFNNQSNLLSSATQRDLYKICLDNGLNMSYNEFSGGPYTDFSKGESIGLGSAPIMIVPAKDLGLPDDLCNSVAGTFQFRMQATIKNPDPYNSISNVELWAIEIDDGVFTIENNAVFLKTAVLTKVDAITAHEMYPWFTYEDLKRPEGGANFFDFLKTAAHHIAKHGPAVANAVHGISHLASQYPQGSGLIGDVMSLDGVGVLGSGRHKHHKKGLRHKMHRR